MDATDPKASASAQDTPQPWNGKPAVVQADGGALQRLPSELCIAIINEISDLESLDSLVRASPDMYRVFGAKTVAVEIVNGLLASERISYHVRVMMCITAMIRSGTLPVKDMREFKSRVVLEAMRWKSRNLTLRQPASRQRYVVQAAERRIREGEAPYYGIAPEQLAGDTEPAVIRSLLATARHISYLSVECLDFYLARFRALRPKAPEDKKFEFKYRCYGAGLRRDRVAAWRSIPEPVSMEVDDVGPPSWIEMQRATRAFWRVQLLGDLKQASARGLLDWVPETASLFPPPVPESRDGSHARFPPCLYHGCQQRTTDDFVENREETSPPPEYHEIKSVANYIAEAYGDDAAEMIENGKLGLAKLADPRELQRQWPSQAPVDGDRKRLVGPSAAAKLWSNRWVEGDEWAPEMKMEFEAYCRFGFAFWSNDRLVGYGLSWRHRAGRFLARFAWLSILEPEELEQVKKRFIDNEDTRERKTMWPREVFWGFIPESTW